VRDARVMDAFAGTGALGLEALSRGAREAIFLESQPAAVALITRNLAALGLTPRARVMQADALLPPPARQPVDLLLLDPPYGGDKAWPAVVALSRAGWLAPGSLIALEVSARESLDQTPGFDLLDDRRYGRARILLFRTL